MDTILLLSRYQKKIYELIYQSMKNGCYEVDLPYRISISNLLIIVKLVLGDNPELINYDNCQIYLESGNFINRLILKPINRHKKNEREQRFLKECDNVLKSIVKPNMYPVQKVLAIHNYLSENVAYEKNIIIGDDIDSHIAYGALVNHRAVCEGIAYAFSYLAHKVNIPATVVNGVANGEEHSWNIVKLGSEFYHIDVTWDMKRLKEDSVNQYDYFCLMDKELITRKWDGSIYPACKSDKYNYFNVTHTVVHNDYELAEKAFEQIKKYNQVYLKFDYINKSYDDTLNHIWNIIQNKVNNESYSLGYVKMILNLEIRTFFLKIDV